MIYESSHMTDHMISNHMINIPFDRNTSNWFTQSSFNAERGFSFRNRATIYFERAAGSASHLGTNNGCIEW